MLARFVLWLYMCRLAFRVYWSRFRWYISWARFVREMSSIPYRGQPVLLKKGKLIAYPKAIERRLGRYRVVNHTQGGRPLILTKVKDGRRKDRTDVRPAQRAH